MPDYLTEWILDFLTDRRLQVFAHGVRSTPIKVNSGCPQGSILGPFLWNLVMESLLESLDKTLPTVAGSYTPSGAIPDKLQENTSDRKTGGFVAYADDLTVWLTGTETRWLMKGAHTLAELIYNWAKKEGISVSSKTKAMYTVPSSGPPPTKGEKSHALPELGR